MSGASSFLQDLPRRGTLTEPDAQGVILSRPRASVCYYDTAPPPGQVVTTDPTNILIRALTSRKAAKEASQKPPATPKDSKGKRPISSAEASGTMEVSASKREKRDPSSPDKLRSSKQGASGVGSSSGSPSMPRVSKAELESYTVDRLRAFLKDRGSPLRGRKEELLARAKRLLGYK